MSARVASSRYRQCSHRVQHRDIGHICQVPISAHQRKLGHSRGYSPGETPLRDLPNTPGDIACFQRQALRGGCLRDRRIAAPPAAAPELEMSVCQHPVVQYEGVGQLHQTGGRNPLRYRRSRLPSFRLQHGIQMRVLGSHTSFTPHGISSGLLLDGGWKEGSPNLQPYDDAASALFSSG